ncbi:MAG TPA: hypothetical protein VJ464_26390 [Blastocatellia bacterium]|nr:hypothetical protein [Blastocatellia bacterium]
MAVGVACSNILKLILRQGMALALVGVVMGRVGVYRLMKYLDSEVNLSKALCRAGFSDPLAYGAIT